MEKQGRGDKTLGKWKKNSCRGGKKSADRPQPELRGKRTSRRTKRRKLVQAPPGKKKK